MIATVVVRVECDRCGHDELYELISLNQRELEGMMKDDGWSTADGEFGKEQLCVRCTNPHLFRKRRKRRPVKK